MKDVYTVKDVARLCKTGEETVRRWIRENKLSYTIKDSKKSQAFISKENLIDFAKNNPKYNAILVASGIVPFVGPAITAALFGGMMSQISREAIDKMQKKNVERYIKSEIENHKMKIKLNQNTIEKLNLENEIEKKQIDDLNELFSELENGDK